MHTDATVSTYNVDPKTGAAIVVGNPVSVVPASSTPASSDFRLVSSPEGHLLYVYWENAGGGTGHISVFATDASGAPVTPPRQTVDVRLFSEFQMHPSGKFIYAIEPVYNLDAFESYFVRFDINSDGTLESPVTLQHFKDAYVGESLYRISGDGTALYLLESVDFDNAVTRKFGRYSVDLTTGDLGPDTAWFGDSGNFGDVFQVLLGDKVMIDQWYFQDHPADSYIDVYANEPSPRTPFIHCTPADLALCATSDDLQLDPTEQYLFIAGSPSNGSSTATVRVLHIDTAGRRLEDTGLAIPSSGGGTFFSPDGKLIYQSFAFSNDSHTNSFRIYAFNTSNGTAQGGETLTFANTDSLFTALRKP